LRRKEPHDGDLAGQPLSKEQGRICRKAAEYKGARLDSQVMRRGDATTPATAVLDSNVVLGLYWFQDPALILLKDALHMRALTWWACAPMREELVHVMRRDGFRHAGRITATATPAQDPDASAQRVMEAFDRLAQLAPSMPNLANPRCTDAEDQVFVDLALGLRVQWLFSRDSAVLKLRRKIQALTGCQVMRPEGWKG